MAPITWHDQSHGMATQDTAVGNRNGSLTFQSDFLHQNPLKRESLHAATALHSAAITLECTEEWCAMADQAVTLAGKAVTYFYCGVLLLWRTAVVLQVCCTVVLCAALWCCAVVLCCCAVLQCCAAACCAVLCCATVPWCAAAVLCCAAVCCAAVSCAVLL